MTPGERLAGPRECGEDVGAYVLGALTEEEAAGFRRHLVDCMRCREEVASLQTAADALPLMAPQLATPHRLRRRLKAQIRKRGDTAPPRPRVPVALRGRAAMALGGALAAAVVVGALVLASTGSSGVRLVQASVTAANASAVVRLTDGHAELIVEHLPQPPSGKIYEVWLKRGGQAPSPTDALFGVTSAGAAAVAVPGRLHGVSEVLVTPEPLGGSLVPTHAAVIVARLS
jgi:anti-sigma-K factor RskA